MLRDNPQRGRVPGFGTEQLEAQAVPQAGRAHARRFHALQQADAFFHIPGRDAQRAGGVRRGFGEKPVFVERLDEVFQDALVRRRQLHGSALQEKIVQGRFPVRLVLHQRFFGVRFAAVGLLFRTHGALPVKWAGAVFDFRIFQLDDRVAGHQLPNITAQLQVVQLQQAHGGLHGERQALSLAEFQIHRFPILSKNFKGGFARSGFVHRPFHFQ